MFRETAKYSWEMVKFYLLTASAFITITIGIVGGLLSSKDLFVNAPSLMGIGIMASTIFPFFMYFILDVGKKNFRRECRNNYEQVGIMMKLETRFNFTYEKRKDEEKILFKNDSFYTPERWKSNEEDWNSEQDFVDHMINDENSYYSHTNTIMIYFQHFSLLLIVILILMGMIIISKPSIVGL